MPPLSKKSSRGRGSATASTRLQTAATERSIGVYATSSAPRSGLGTVVAAAALARSAAMSTLPDVFSGSVSSRTRRVGVM